jgi:SAM-dependent methyltransferase
MGIYGDLPKEHIVLSKPISSYIDSIEKIVSEDREQLIEYFPHLRLIKELNEKIPIRNILEVGCGSGMYSYVIYRYFQSSFNFYLIDYSRNALFDAEKLFMGCNNVHIMRADAFNLPIKDISDNTIDVCITGGLIEHFNLDDQINLLTEIKRVSKNQIHQYPCSTPSYWIQRWIVSLFNGGRWPFGFEIPINRNRELQLFPYIERSIESSPFKRLEFKLNTNRKFAFKKLLQSLNNMGLGNVASTDKIILIVSHIREQIDYNNGLG